MPLPPRFADLKQKIAESYPDFERRVTDAWAEIIQQLKVTSEIFKREGSDVGFFFLFFECLWNSSNWVMSAVYTSSPFCRAAQPLGGNCSEDSKSRKCSY